ncbi:tyrosine-type recombinase/integrase [Staphylococcus kloosii]|uniref:tyrosine-type recombinase/integrase n=1 Tax=Staphylococcus kloosii TaxID=29384 RepID=UPI002B4BDC38|nr:site-specific integrase [Staphylococcus kloosii]
MSEINNLTHAIEKDTKRGTYFFRVRYYDQHKKRKEIRRSGFKQRKQCVIALNNTLDELDGLINEVALSFEDLASEYAQWYKARRKASSYKALKTHLNNHLLPYFKGKDVYKLTTTDIMKFQNKKLTENHAADYLKKMHVFLVSLLNFAMTYHDLPKNVATLVVNFEIENKKRLNYWTLEEFNKFYDYLDNIEKRTFFKLLFYTGARKGEIRALTWEDINFQEDYIYIDKTNYNGIVTSPKTKAGIREIYLPTHMMNDLKALKDWYKSEKVFKQSYVVFGNYFNSVADSTIDRWFKNALTKLENDLKDDEVFNRIVIHELRHSHASMLVNAGASIMIIAQRLGHSDSTEVYNRYGHLYPSTQKEIIKYL